MTTAGKRYIIGDKEELGAMSAKESLPMDKTMSKADDLEAEKKFKSPYKEKTSPGEFDTELEAMDSKDILQINKTTSGEDSSIEDEQIEVVNQHQEMTTGGKRYIIGDKEELGAMSP